MPTWEDIVEKELDDFTGSGGSGPALGSVVLFEFQAGRFNTELHGVIARHDLESNPRAKAEINWTWSAGKDWALTGTDISHPEGDDKRVNAGTDLGRLFKALTQFPELAGLLSDGWSPKKGACWKELTKVGDFEWTFVREPKRVQKADGTWGTDDNPDNQKTILLPTAFFPKGGSNGKVEGVDLASLGLTDDQMTAAIDAAKGGGDYGAFAVALAGFGSAGVNAVISDVKAGEALRVQLAAIS